MVEKSNFSKGLYYGGMLSLAFWLIMSGAIIMLVK